MAVDDKEFRHALRNLASGVTVITAPTPDGLAGITVTSFTSLSLRPPLVLFCLDQRAWLHDRLPVGAPYAVNFLSADQTHVSQQFASREADRFAGMNYTLSAAGSPLLAGALATLECRVVDRLPGGDHTIIVGEVQSTQTTDNPPLLHFRGQYARLGE